MNWWIIPVKIGSSQNNLLTGIIERFALNIPKIPVWWRLPDSNWGHKALQASALPTELKRQIVLNYGG